MDKLTPRLKYINSKLTELTTYKHTHTRTQSDLTGWQSAYLWQAGKCDISGRILRRPCCILRQHS